MKNHQIDLRRLSLEAKLLFKCAKPSFSKNNNMPWPMAHELNWHLLFILAGRHKVIPLFYQRIKQIYPELPKDFERLCKTHWQTNISRNLFLNMSAIRILKCMNERDVSPLVLGEPAISKMVFDKEILREQMNLRFMVKPSEINEAKKALLSLGYRGSKANHFRGKQPFVTLVDGAQMPKKLQTLDFGSYQVKTLTPEDLLVSMCSRGANKEWRNLKSLCDPAFLLNNLAAKLDWSYVFSRAKQLKSENALLLGLHLVNSILDAPLSQVALQKINKHPYIARIARRYWHKLAKPTLQLGELKRNLFYELALKDGVAKRGRTALSHTATRCKELVKSYRPNRSIGMYVPSPKPVVSQMLSLAKITKNDILYDLGCGDGSIVIAAAKRFGVKAIGFDIDPVRIKEARKNAKTQKVDHLTTFHQKDITKIDLSKATIVTIYLLHFGIGKLFKKLKSNLTSGTQVICHHQTFFDGWIPEKIESVVLTNNTIRYVDLWTANSSGCEAITSSKN